MKPKHLQALAERSSSVRGALAGVGGTAVLALFERLETRMLGARPVYSPRGVARRWFGGTAVQGALLRAGYGTLLGALLFRTRCFKSKRSMLGAALASGAAIAAAELILMPATHATPPLARWRPEERAMLAAHACAYALAGTAFSSLLHRRGAVDARR